ncbi:MAG: methyl-accepting chemotaxis protein [Pseudomonadota bacterium]
MHRLSISRSIAIGLLSILAVLGAFVGLSLYSTDRLSSSFLNLNSVAERTRIVLSIKESLYNLRLDTNHFQRAPSPDGARAVIDGIDAIETAAPSAIALYADEPDLRAHLEDLLRLMGLYRTTFEQLRGVTREHAEISITLDEQALAIAQRLGETTVMARAYGQQEYSVLSNGAEVLFTQVRLNLESYRRTEDMSLFDAFSKGLSDTAMRINSMLEDNMQFEALTAAQTLMAEFLVAAPRLRDLIDARNQLGADRPDGLDGIGKAALARLHLLLDSAVREQAGTGAQGIETASAIQIRMSVLAAAAIPLAALLSWLLARSVAGRVSRMAEKMGRLAGGDLEIEISGTSHAHELGRMARALETFRENATRVARLADDKEAADRAAAEERAAMMRELQEAFGSVVDAAVAGDFSRRVEVRFADQALNDLAAGVNRLVETVDAGVTLTADAMARMADGELSEVQQAGFSGAFERLQGSINATVRRLSDLVGSIRQTSVEVGSASHLVNDGASKLSQRVEQQASALEQTAATMEEMSQTVKANAESAASASDLSSLASESADRGRNVVAEAVGAMNGIEEGSRKIADIITVIDGIAFQTNLLALNAAVEAARAGEAGKGFAVVASEVRSLAQRSSDAARDIRQLIKSSTEQVTNGVRLVEQTGASLDEIVEGIRQVAQTVEAIKSASSEQAAGISEISQSVGHMDEMTQQNAELAQQSSTSARNMQEHAHTLDKLIGFFKTETNSARAA